MSGIIRTIKTKQISQEVFSAMTNKQRLQSRMSRWCSSKIIHRNIHRNQANSNTKINIGHSFKDTEVRLCHSKVLKLHFTHSLVNVALKFYVVSLSQAFSTFKSRNPKRQSLLNLHHLQIQSNAVQKRRSTFPGTSHGISTVI